MKKLLLLVFFVYVSTSESDAQGYTFTRSTQAYSDLTNASVLSSSGWDYMTIFSLGLPFPFEFFGSPVDSFHTAPDFGGFYYDQISTFLYVVAFYESLLQDRGTNTSPISFKVDGMSPSRILKFEVKNAGFASDFTGNDYTNHQVWFYEGSYIIEFRYGPNSVNNIDSWLDPSCLGPFVYLDDLSNFIYLSGSASNPIANTSGMGTCLTGAPPNGSVFRFTPTSTSIDEIGLSQSYVYPNPSNGSFFVHGLETSSASAIEIFDLKGQIVYSNSKITYNEAIHTNLPSGLYFFRMIQKNLVITSKIVVR